MLGELAKKGILTMPTPMFWQLARSRGISGRRQDVRQGTAHNDKLGFDWDVPAGAFFGSQESGDKKMTSHPISSQYLGFLKEFKKTLDEIETTDPRMSAVLAHVNRAISAFNKSPEEFAALLNRNQPEIDAVPAGNAYPTERLKGLELELSHSRK